MRQTADENPAETPGPERFGDIVLRHFPRLKEPVMTHLPTAEDHQQRGEALLAEAEELLTGDPAVASALAAVAQTHFFAAQSRAAVEGMTKTVTYLEAEQDRVLRYEAAAAASREALR